MTTTYTTFEIRENPDTGKVDVIEINGTRETVCGSYDDIDTATDEWEGFQEARFAELEARAAGDDPRYDPPYDPHAEQHEREQVQRDFEAGECEDRDPPAPYDASDWLPHPSESMFAWQNGGPGLPGLDYDDDEKK